MAFIATILNLVWVIQQSCFLRLEALTRGWTYLDLTSIGMNLYLSMNIFTDIDVISSRYVEALLVIVMSFKSLYYMRLIKEVAPLIDAMSNILVDIRWFLFLFCVYMVSHAEALNSLSFNQYEITYLENPAKALVGPYYSMKNLFWNTYKAHTGGMATTFFLDTPEMVGWWFGFYVYVTLFVKMLLFNMLIGLMGASIARSKQDADAKKRLQMCGFLTDNWHMNAVENKQEVVYIISARQITVEEEVDENLINIEKKIDGVEMKSNNLLKEVDQLKDYIHDIRR